MTSGDPTEPVLKLESSQVEWRHFGDEVVLLDLRTSTYLSTNPAATLLWRRLESGATRTHLIEALVEDYEVEPDTAAKDVDAFLEDCRRRELLAEPDGT